MRIRSYRRPVLAALLVLLAGCGGSDPGRFIPPPDRARRALEAALEAWRRGEPRGQVPGASSPAVQFGDSVQKPERRLRAYTVLGLAPGDGPRVFTVRLDLDEPPQEVRARYVVVGIDPVWVLRQEDYDMIAHWDCPPADHHEHGAAAP